MPNVNVKVTWKTDDFTAALDRIGREVLSAAGDADNEAAKLFNTTAGALAPHESGRLAASFRIDGPHLAGFKWTAKVGPTTPYGRREAIGFHGRDSIGRRYHEGGHTFMSPAQAVVVSRFNSILARHVGSVLPG